MKKSLLCMILALAVCLTVGITASAVDAVIPLTADHVEFFYYMEYTGEPQIPVAEVMVDGVAVDGVWSAVTNVGEESTFTPADSRFGTLTMDPGMEKAWLYVESGELFVEVGGEVPVPTYTITGFVGEDDLRVVSGEPVLAYDETPDTSDTGSYFILIEEGTLSADNYYFSPGYGILNVLEHIHSFTGEVSLGTTVSENDTILVVCDAEDCPDDGEVKVILDAPKDAVYDGSLWHTTSLYSDMLIDLDSQDIVYSADPFLPGTYTASITYGGQTASVTYTVAKRTLTLTAEDQAAHVGSAAPEYTYTVSGLAYDHVLGGQVTVTSAAAELSALGTYEITVDASGLSVLEWDTDVTEHYEIVTVSGTLTVGNDPIYPVDLRCDEYGSAVIESKRAYSGRTVAVAVETDEGFVVKGVAVTTETGEQIAVADEGDGQYSFVMPLDAVTVRVEIGMPFEDITADGAHYDAIRWVYANGYMIGKKANSFDAESDITRQQICMVLSRMEGEELSHMAEAFAWGVENELLEADRPGEAATVREMVTMLWKWFGEPEVEPGEQEASPDAGALTHEEQMAMAWAVEMGIVEDASASGDTLARGVFAQVLYRSFGD